LDLTDGSADNLRELMEMYLKQTNKQFEQMQAAIADQNGDTLRRLAHSCAGSSATLGMTQLALRLKELEKLGVAGHLADAPKTLMAAAQEYQRVQEFIKIRAEFANVRTENLLPV
jgi:HPt (histidine-containing phosphotransfer) domain-containing protein